MDAGTGGADTGRVFRARFESRSPSSSAAGSTASSRFSRELARSLRRLRSLSLLRSFSLLRGSGAVSRGAAPAGFGSGKRAPDGSTLYRGSSTAACGGGSSSGGRGAMTPLASFPSSTSSTSSTTMSSSSKDPFCAPSRSFSASHFLTIETNLSGSCTLDASASARPAFTSFTLPAFTPARMRWHAGEDELGAPGTGVGVESAGSPAAAAAAAI
mmetsp:Transcript_72109/g.136128  ORF Transcript_72109/g.136128 Transcript_72109/m.136128 type:complete len:214 (-) Transcript_72109:514-1155(-)